MDVLTKYKRSTQKNHRHIMKKHLVPRFGDLTLCDVTPQVIQTARAAADRIGSELFRIVQKPDNSAELTH